MPATPSRRVTGRQVYTRLPELLAHLSYFAFQPQVRLAQEAGVSRSTINRLIRGKVKPTYAVVQAIQQVLDARIGRVVPTPEWLSLDGTYPTAYVCQVVGCPGCLPEQAYNRDGSLKPAFAHIAPGQWTVQDIQQEEVQEAT